MALAESFLHSQAVSVLLCIDNISAHWWPLQGPLGLCAIGIVPLPFQALHNKSNFSLLCALWGLISDECSFSGHGAAVVPGWDPDLDRWWGEVSAALRCHWGMWLKWVHLAGTCGHFIMYPALSCLQHPPLGALSLACRGGRLAPLILWCLGTQERSHLCTARLWGAGVAGRGGGSPVSPVLCVWPVEVWGAVGQKCFIFCSDLRHKWDLSQHGNAQLVHRPLPVPSGLSLSDAALAWVPHLCTPCCCSLCYSQLSSCCHWQFPDCPVSPEKYAPEHIPYNTTSETQPSNPPSFAFWISTLHLDFLPYHSTPIIACALGLWPLF